MGIFGNLAEMSWNQSICSRVVTRASLSAKPESAEARMIPAIFGPSSPASFAYFDPASCCWKTSQATFLLDLAQYSETWPDSGTMRNGCVYERQTLAHRILESAYSLWPTTRSTSGGGNTSAYPNAPYRPALAQLASRWPTARSEDSESCGNHPNSEGDSLTGVTRHWVTPQGHQGGANSQREACGAGGPDLKEQAQLWGTPNANERTHDPRQVDHGAQLANQVDTWLTPHGMSRTDAGGGEFAHQANHWQTPAVDSFRSRGGERVDEMGLDQQARFFPTPSARDWKSGDASPATMERNARPLNEICEHWTTPTKRANEHCSSELNRKTPALESQALLQDHLIPTGQPSSEADLTLLRHLSLENAANAPKRRLNPRFVEWLMGFPIGWTER